MIVLSWLGEARISEFTFTLQFACFEPAFQLSIFQRASDLKPSVF